MNNFIYENLKKLKKIKIPNPEIDLRILLNYSKFTNEEIILSNFNINQINIKKFNFFLERRLKNEPISKILNKKYFWKDDFFVNEYVLDPRPETEGIIEESKNYFKDNKIDLKILDIGTGSGAIAISLSREFPNSEITAIDISKDAIKIAKKNINKKKLQDKIQLINTSIDSIENKFDLIVSNPPYLTKKELLNLSINIKNYEPLIALDGGVDGLDFYRNFSSKIPKIMKKKAYFIFEIGSRQFSDCRDIFANNGLKFEKKIQDLQKKDRIMVYSKL